MISAEEIRTKLDGYPEELFEQYDQFLKDKNPDQLNNFVIGLLRFLHDASGEPITFTGDTNLREDLGVDSITIAEVIFQLEDIFEVEIDNQKLLQTNTVEQLKSYIMSKLT